MRDTRFWSEPSSSAKPALPSATLLECGHPGLPNNLKDGKCGTCQCADEWDELAKETKDVNLKALTLKIANCFRNGSMVYDKNGKTLMEIEEASRPHSTRAMSDCPPTIQNYDRS